MGQREKNGMKEIPNKALAESRSIQSEEGSQMEDFNFELGVLVRVRVRVRTGQEAALASGP